MINLHQLNKQERYYVVVVVVFATITSAATAIVTTGCGDVLVPDTSVTSTHYQSGAG